MVRTKQKKAMTRYSATTTTRPLQLSKRAGDIHLGRYRHRHAGLDGRKPLARETDGTNSHHLTTGNSRTGEVLATRSSFRSRMSVARLFFDHPFRQSILRSFAGAPSRAFLAFAPFVTLALIDRLLSPTDGLIAGAVTPYR
jgi:hypothetical protein